MNRKGKYDYKNIILCINCLHITLTYPWFCRPMFISQTHKSGVACERVAIVARDVNNVMYVVAGSRRGVEAAVLQGQ